MKEFCADLEIAKELKEKGFPQECMFRYCCFDQSEKNLVIKYINESNFGLQYITDAPTSDELLKELPESIINKVYWMYIIKDFDKNFQIFYENICDIKESKLKFRIINKKLSNCLALAWLHLKKEKLL